MEQQLQKLIESSLKDLKFGSVEIVVHDGRVAQIERRERFRAFRDTDGTPPNHPNHGQEKADR